MIEQLALMGKDKAALVLGESSLHDHIGHALQLSYVVVLVGLEGQALININMKKYPIKAHDVFVLYDDSFAMLMQASKKFKLFYCLIDKTLAAEIAYPLPNTLFSFLQDSPRCVLDAKAQALLALWRGQLHSIYHTAGQYQYIMLRNHLQNLFLHIAQHMPSSTQTLQHKSSRKEQLCWAFWEMIGQHCKQQREVAFYAEKLSITPYYLAQISKAIFNDRPKDLIHRQVLLEMKILLVSTEYSVQQIADQLSFEDPAYMCRYFKRQTGISLSQYRKQHV